MQHLINLLEYVVDRYPTLAEAKIDVLFDKFKKQLGKSQMYRGKVSDKALKYAIEQFGKYKEGLPPDQRDIQDWTAAELLNFLNSKPGYNPPEEADSELPPDAPPVVYEKDGLTIFDGSKEDRCIKYGKGESWCITKGSFAGYRYSADKKYPTFYLVKDDNLPKSNPKSFFVVMVGNDNTYKASDRTNNDVGGRGSEWQRWENWSFVEQHFPSVKGLEHLFKYRPIPASELVARGRYTLEQWVSASPKQKQSILTAKLERESNQPFDNINWRRFIQSVLPHYRSIGDWMPTMAYAHPLMFAKNYPYFSEQQQKSIIKHLNTPGHDVNLTAGAVMKDDEISPKFVLDLIKANRLPPSENMHVYADKKNNIITLDLSDHSDDVIEVTKEYPNGAVEKIDLDKEDEHLIANDPYFDKIPLTKLEKTIQHHNLSNNLLKKGLESSKGSVEAIKVDDKEFILQKPSLSIIQLGGEKLDDDEPYPDKVLDTVDELIETNDEVREAFYKKLNKAEPTPYRKNPARLTGLLRKLPNEKRVFQSGSGKSYITPGDNTKVMWWTFAANADDPSLYFNGIFELDSRGALRRSWGSVSRSHISTAQTIEYLLGQVIPPLSDDGARRLLDSVAGSQTLKAESETIARVARLSEDNIYKLAYADNTLYLLNTTSREGSFMVSPRNSNRVMARLSQTKYNALMGTRPATAEPAAQATPTAAPPATAQGGNTNLVQVLDQHNLRRQILPDSVTRRLQQGGTPKNTQNDRGSSTRNYALRRAGIGRVSAAYQLAGTASALYIITLTSGTVVAAIAMQPGNVQILLTNRGMVRMRSADDLVQSIQGSNLRENENDMENNAQLLRKLVERILRENQPAPSRPAPGTRPEPGIADPGTETEEDDEDSDFAPPADAPDTRPKAEKEKVSLGDLVKRYKSENN